MATTTKTANETTKPVLYKGYTDAQLRAAFELVQNPIDWRAPIDFRGDMHPEDVEAAKVAIEFFTATKATVVEINGDVIIQADGYRAGPAGPR